MMTDNKYYFLFCILIFFILSFCFIIFFIAQTQAASGLEKLCDISPAGQFSNCQPIPCEYGKQALERVEKNPTNFEPNTGTFEGGGAITCGADNFLASLSLNANMAGFTDGDGTYVRWLYHEQSGNYPNDPDYYQSAVRDGGSWTSTPPPPPASIDFSAPLGQLPAGNYYFIGDYTQADQAYNIIEIETMAYLTISSSTGSGPDFTLVSQEILPDTNATTSAYFKSFFPHSFSTDGDYLYRARFLQQNLQTGQNTASSSWFYGPGGYWFVQIGAGTTYPSTSTSTLTGAESPDFGWLGNIFYNVIKWAFIPSNLTQINPNNFFYGLQNKIPFSYFYDAYQAYEDRQISATSTDILMSLKMKDFNLGNFNILDFSQIPGYLASIKNFFRITCYMFLFYYLLSKFIGFFKTEAGND
jgi:hypothetical protein